MRLFKHPLHPMLVMFPVAIFPLLLFLDALQWWLDAPQLWDAAFWLAVAGLASTLAAIVPGVADMRPLQDGTREHRIGVIHAVLGTLTLVAFLAAVWVRWTAGADSLLLAASVDLAGVALVSAQGWLGGELVYHHHVGVQGIEEGGAPAAIGADPAAGSHASRGKKEGRAE